MGDDHHLVGKRIAKVEWTNGLDDEDPIDEDGKYVRLEFDDGSVAIISGTGYDGLWDDVGIEYFGPDHAK